MEESLYETELKVLAMWSLEWGLFYSISRWNAKKGVYSDRCCKQSWCISPRTEERRTEVTFKQSVKVQIC